MSAPPPRHTLHEAAHKLPEDGHDDAPSSPTSGTGMRRSLNEAAHKLGHWSVRPAPDKPAAEPSPELAAALDDQRDVVAHAGRLVLALGALGIVYGDIGTSPLYTVQTIFQQHP